MENISQLSLPFLHEEGSLKAYLEKAAGKAVSLVITENSSSMLSVKTNGCAVSVRLHKMFLHAGPDVLREIAGLIKNRRKNDTPHIRRFIRNNTKYIQRKPKRLKILTAGRFYDLMEIYNSVNAAYFNGKISARITWGAKSPKRAVRRRILGSFNRHDRVIRINPLLDSAKTPRYYLEYVVYHEMLHADMDAACGKRAHSSEFRKRERLFKHYDKALMWEKRM
ncbi:MAG: M48 family metallopeptidase [Nitrospirae bacterium]|nr:M48 family metallopeptidase [Nitrospirota bacterium]